MKNCIIFITIISMLLTLGACEGCLPVVNKSETGSESQAPAPPPPPKPLPTKCSEVSEASDCKDEIDGKPCEWKIDSGCQDKEQEIAEEIPDENSDPEKEEKTADKTEEFKEETSDETEKPKEKEPEKNLTPEEENRIKNVELAKNMLNFVVNLDKNKPVQELVKDYIEILTNNRKSIDSEELKKELDAIETTKGTEEEKNISVIETYLKKASYANMVMPDEVKFKEQSAELLSKFAAEMFDKTLENKDKLYYLDKLNSAYKIVAQDKIDENARASIEINLKEKRDVLFENVVDKEINLKDKINKFTAIHRHILTARDDKSYFREKMVNVYKEQIKSLKDDNFEKNSKIVASLLQFRKNFESEEVGSIARESLLSAFGAEQIRRLVTITLNNEQLKSDDIDNFLLEAVWGYSYEPDKIFTLEMLKNLIKKIDFLNIEPKLCHLGIITSIIEKLSKSTKEEYKNYFESEKGKKVLTHVKKFSDI